jgi:hypothetical protein
VGRASLCDQNQKLSFRPEQGGLFFLLHSSEGAALRSGGTSLTLSFVFEYLTLALSVSQRPFPE